MNPRLLLSLWRERWGKASSTTLMKPYVKGKLNHWGRRVAYASAWSLPGATVIALLLCVFILFILILPVRFSLNSQIVFSVFFVCIALYARRYAGTLITLALVGLSFIASTRYLYWRFNETLGSNFNADFILGFCLCVAELYLWLLMVLGFMQAVWPLKQAHVPMPDDAADWPTVDVLVPCQGQSQSAMEMTAMAVFSLDWPKDKIKIYILDDHHRDDIKELAVSIDATYLAYPENLDGRAGNLNRAMPEMNGELIAMFDGDQTPDKSFLQMTIGWFVQDSKLGIIQSPHHFLAPAPSKRSLQLFDTRNMGMSCAVIRRSMLVEVGGAVSEPLTDQAHTALKLQEFGYASAYLGFTKEEISDNKKESVAMEPDIRYTTEIFRVDHPFEGKTLVWKQRLSSLHAMLQFYYAVPRMIFFTAPLAYLLAEAHIIQTSAELFAAYVLPHLMQGYIAQARMQGNKRFTAWVDIREMVLAWYVLLRTTMTLIRAELGRCCSALKIGTVDKDDLKNDPIPFDWAIALPYAIILVLNLAGFVIGIVRLLPSGASDPEVAVPYLLWSAYNLMILMAILAVAEESRHVRRQIRLQLRVPAMVRLPSGHSVSCVTENFPEPVLSLSLPTPVALENGVALSISIFRGSHEFAFPAQVISQQGQILRVAIEDAGKNDYRTLGVAAFSRGQDWPKWLPGRDTDHPFPLWLNKAFVAVHVAALKFVARYGKYVRRMRIDRWIQTWKKKK